MGRLRVWMEHVQALDYPSVCPCCLGAPAVTPTRLVKGGAVVYTSQWPHCESCARNEKRRLRSLFWTQALAVIGLLVLAVGSPVLFLNHRGGGYAALAVGAVLPAVAIVLHRGNVSRLPKPANAVRKGAGVIINHGGAHLLGTGYVVDVTFLQSEYGRQFIELNRSVVVKSEER